jgi:hypothetical protein
MRGRRLALAVLALLALAKSLEWWVAAKMWEREHLLRSATEVRVVDRISAALRRTLADILWLRVDEYVHHGPRYALGSGRLGEQKLGVSWRTTPEVIPLMRLVVRLDPHFVQAGKLLATDLILNQRRVREGTELFLHLIAGNAGHPRLYQLYGELGRSLWCLDMPGRALPYLSRAVELSARLSDANLLKDWGEPPPNRGDRIACQLYATALVDSAIVQQNYELALATWRSLGTWMNPDNPDFQVLMAYMRARQEGTVKPALLAALRERLRREEQLRQERQKDRTPAQMETHLAAEVNRLKATLAHQEPPGHLQGVGLKRMASPMEVLEFHAGEGRWFKLAGLLVLVGVLAVWGTAGRWVHL